jgi:tRNA(Arg) A34 adenosine deaminase TadA
MPLTTSVTVSLPDWTGPLVLQLASRPMTSDEERMRLVLALTQANVQRRSGGPFGAAVFDEGGGLVSVGLNSVVRLGNSLLHAEVMAIMLAQAAFGSWALHERGTFTLMSSCAPCAQCLGAIHWSGIHRVVCAATRADATALGFDEGPVFPESYRYMEERGIVFGEALLREEARTILADYLASGAPVYNA